jgi:hypothetical protein
MVTKKEGGQEGDVVQLLSGIVAIEGYLQFDLSFLFKTHFFRFRLLQLYK